MILAAIAEATSPMTTRGSIVSESLRASSTSQSSISPSSTSQPSISKRSTAADLLPPGADAEQPQTSDEATQAWTAQPIAPVLSPPPPISVPPLPAAVFDKVVRVGQSKSPEERAQLRFWKNLIVFAVLVVVLLVVFWAMAR